MSGPVASAGSQLDHVMAIMEAAFDPAWGEAWNRRQVSDALTMPNTHAFVVNDAGELLDFAASPQTNATGFLLTRYAPGEAELLLIGVRPEMRGRGLGERLIAVLRDHARSHGAERIFLEMRENNPAAELYRKVGFEPIGRRRAYYLLADGTRMDAITYALSL
ncbi:MAG: ribosomal-protein-alanine acetyltransferase [Sphingomonadales bacterium BRH_c3]|nr:MAG: ribosomal-protein-alanine acetyltransferase [Sphingomonadales bacterium BRH_c3]